MGKLVLGIIGVTLLQIAFFVYMATDGQEYAEAGSVKPGPVVKNPQRAADPPEVIIPSTPTTPAAMDSEQAKVKTSAVTGRSLAGIRMRPNARDRDRAARPPARVLASASATATRSTREWDAVPKRSGRWIPSGYTMALVDYPPAAARIKAPGVPSIKTRAAASIQTKDISQPRKRSFIARAAPALVKKPWSWIKSLASKLD